MYTCMYTYTHIHTLTHTLANYDSCRSVLHLTQKPSRQGSNTPPGTLEAPFYTQREEAGTGLSIIPLS